MADLKPCPFCGGEAELIETEESWMGPGLILVKCKNGPCSCQTPALAKPSVESQRWTTRHDELDRKEAVIKIWNRRVGEDG